MRRPLFCCGIVTFLFAISAAGRNLTPAWVELGPDGRNVARLVVDAADACPTFKVDGRRLAAQRREPVPAGFPPVCELAIPPNTKSLAFEVQKLRLPRTPNSVIVFGDTGCRVTTRLTQACNDPAAWPFLQDAKTIANARPDLIVHVGDYLYREDACPNAARGCAGPHGDNWETWKADFFDPAAVALAATPWVFTRGNHESCARSWRGWFYYLDPRPFNGKCIEESDEWIAQSGTLRIGVMDSALVVNSDTASSRYVPQMAAQMSRLSGHVDWITVHHPFWAYLPAPTAAMDGAWAKAKPEGVNLIVSGHVHLFEFLGFGPGHPSQLIAGTGGTNLDAAIQPRLAGKVVLGLPLQSGESRHEFGYTELRRVKRGSAKGWKLELMELDGSRALSCKLPLKGDPQCAN